MNLQEDDGRVEQFAKFDNTWVKWIPSQLRKRWKTSSEPSGPIEKPCCDKGVEIPVWTHFEIFRCFLDHHRPCPASGEGQAPWPHRL